MVTGAETAKMIEETAFHDLDFNKDDGIELEELVKWNEKRQNAALQQSVQLRNQIRLQSMGELPKLAQPNLLPKV